MAAGNYSLTWHRQRGDRNEVTEIFEKSALIAQFNEHPTEFIALARQMVDLINAKATKEQGANQS